MLEKHLQASNTSSAVLYSLREIEDLVLGQWKQGKPKPEYLLLTNKYLSNSSEKNRINRLVQVAKNKNVKTRIVDAETAAGIRITQLGGLVCFTRTD
jgi:stalled ribosome rescue protein Dom34